MRQHLVALLQRAAQEQQLARLTHDLDHAIERLRDPAGRKELGRNTQRDRAGDLDDAKRTRRDEQRLIEERQHEAAMDSTVDVGRSRAGLDADARQPLAFGSTQHAAVTGIMPICTEGDAEEAVSIRPIERGAKSRRVTHPIKLRARPASS